MNSSDLAQEVLELVWGNKIFPVDPVSISRKLGLQVMETDLPEDVSGALIKEVGKDPIIIVHYSDSDARKRFTCAHELGHFIYRTKNLDIDTEEFEYVDLRDSVSSQGTDAEEVFANQFAASILMPEKEIKSYYKKHGDLLKTSLYFGVSAQAAEIRLRNLNLL